MTFRCCSCLPTSGRNDVVLTSTRGGTLLSADDMRREFCRRFCDFEKIEKSLQLVSCPLSQDPVTAPQELQLELIDLQSDSVLKEKFNSLKLNDFYASPNEATFPDHWWMAKKLLTLFGSPICVNRHSAS